MQGTVSLERYRYHLDAFEARLRHRDLPRDIGQLMALVFDIERALDKDSIDLPYYR